MAMRSDNLAFMTVEEDPKKLTEDTWIADSGTMCHITNSLEGLYDLKDINERVKLGNGNKVVATKCGKL